MPALTVLLLGFVYPWSGQPLVERFAAPPGFVRVAVGAQSFGAWLRALPLLPPETPVLSYRGQLVRAGDDEHVAAVAALDVGTRDLQQCADSIVRLHAEWRWARGRRDHSYQSAEGVALPFTRFLAGERVVERDHTLIWQPRPGGSAAQAPTHAAFRRYLDLVFTWANTGSLAAQARRVPLSELLPGDLLVLPGAPGHAVLVLDVAATSDGRRVALIGQGFMPAQSFHVLRPARGSPWFAIDPAAPGLQTPFWPAVFPWSSLRRLPD
ncbi:MAG TPA: DUF4846 domain-containing protein [Polyangia bacterium]|nr:DUF4846 domain-containing protein [Polyangia bacterium]